MSSESALGAHIGRVSRGVRAWPLAWQRSMATFTPSSLRESTDDFEAEGIREAAHRRAVADYMDANDIESLTVGEILRTKP